MNDTKIAGICCCTLAILISALVVGLYIYFIKRVKTYLLISTFFVAVAVSLEAATNIVFQVMGSNISESSCRANLVFQLIGEYFISFWCGSISIMFMVALHTASTSAGNGVSIAEKLTFYITLSVAAVVSIVLPIIILCTDTIVYIAEAEWAPNIPVRCWIGNEDHSSSIADVSITDRPTFYYLDLPIIICMIISLIGIVYAIIISRLAKSPKHPDISAPSKQYYIMLGSTLGLYVAGQTPMIVLNLASASDMIYNTGSMNYMYFQPLINCFLPIPIWVCTIYAFSKITKDLSSIAKGQDQFVKLLESGTSDELLYSSYSENSYS